MSAFNSKIRRFIPVLALALGLGVAMSGLAHAGDGPEVSGSVQVRFGGHDRGESEREPSRERAYKRYERHVTYVTYREQPGHGWRKRWQRRGPHWR